MSQVRPIDEARGALFRAVTRFKFSPKTQSTLSISGRLFPQTNICLEALLLIFYITASTYVDIQHGNRNAV